MSDEELIRAFYNDSANESEQEMFKLKYESDEVFREEAERMKSEIEAFKQVSRESIRAKFTEWEEEQKEGKQVHLGAFWKMGIAATLVIASFIGYLNWSSEDLYSAYYSTYPNYEYTTTRGESLDDLKSRAFGAYDQGNFSAAKTYFDELIDQSDNSTYHLFRGLSLMELQDFSGASTDFEKVIQSDSSYKETALWYGALSALQTDDHTRSINYLKQLTQSDDYSEEAEELLDKLMD